MERSKRHLLYSAIQEVRAWVDIAKEVRHLASHLPLSDPIVLSSEEAGLLSPLEESATKGDPDNAARLAKVAWFGGKKKLDAEQSAARIWAVHSLFKSSDHSQRLRDLRAALLVRAAQEREELSQIVADLYHLRARAHQMLHCTAHLPISRTDALPTQEMNAAESLIKVVDGHSEAAISLLDTSACSAGHCTQAHISSKVLHEVYAEALQTGLFEQIEDTAARVSAQLSTERNRLPAILEDLGRWRSAATQTLTDAEHLLLTRTGALSKRETEAIRELSNVHDRNIGAGKAFHPSLCDTGSCVELHKPLADLAAYHLKVALDGVGELVEQAAVRLAGQVVEEREQLRNALNNLDAWQTSALQAQENVDHMPLTRSGVLSDSERKAINAIGGLVPHGDQARKLLDPNECTSGACRDKHSSGALLGEFYLDAIKSGIGVEIVEAAKRVAAQLTQERQQVARLRERLIGWPTKALTIRQSRRDANDFIKLRLAKFERDKIAVKIDRISMVLIPLGAGDEHLVGSLALLHSWALTDEDEQFLAGATKTAKDVLSAMKAAFTSQLECRASGKCWKAHELIPGVNQRADMIEDKLARLDVDMTKMPNDIDLLLDPSVGFMGWVGEDLANPELLPAATMDRAHGKLAAIVHAASAAKDAAAKARKAAEIVRSADVANALKGMDLEVLRKASPHEGIRIAPLEAYDLHNVWETWQFAQQFDLASLHGLGKSSAHAITQASLRLYGAVRDETPVRIDVRRKTVKAATLLESLRLWNTARKFDPTEEEVALAGALTAVFQKESFANRVLTFTEGTADHSPPLLNDLLTSALDRMTPPMEAVDIWQEFLSHPADYFGMLTELGFMTEDEKKMHGDLPKEIIEAVRAKELKRDFLTASLRAYQSFGARFALVQEKVVIGDEMGLGKTVEALAVFAHLRSTGQSHFLVVCPAAVVSNWIRETAKHTKLSATRLHGPLRERDYAAKSWMRNSGVAVTTYDLLPWAQGFLKNVELGCAVFDEAHYIKNPMAKRSLAAAEVMDPLKYAILMTGTPLENSVQEFRNLIGYIRSDLSESAPDYLASKFRKHVAPAYLRRNLEDVLTELPELVEIDEWMDMSGADERVYRDAVHAGNFMLMRRAAMLSRRSMKFERLREIVEEAEANGRRVIVFSYFREVLKEIAGSLPGEVFGPLTGSLPAAQRQALIDRFSEARHGAVLVAQIVAGGVGLNIQSASVVVICEPQLKPTMESQAIARAHRMGQTMTVQVHRLLTENSVDERIREILEDKKQLFDQFARDSVIAKQAPDAVDFSESELTRLIVATERERLFAQTENAAK